MLLKVVPLFFLRSAVLAVPSRPGSRADARPRPNDQPAQVLRLDHLDSVVYNTIWAGAVLNKDINTVTGTFTVPSPLGNEGDSASVAVGIDGITCTGSMLQAGIDLTVTSGNPTYGAWYQFAPGFSNSFSPSDMTICQGDVIRVNATAFSSTSGRVTMENFNSHQTVSMDLTSPASSPLCGQNAIWFIEEYYVDSSGHLVPLTNFGTVTFKDASADSYLPADGGSTLDIKQNDRVLTASSISGSTVTIQYVGN